jgi:glycine/D-amino acid oxidase-like deaminating enzyme
MIDFLVIGGGIAGLSAAARLSHLGSVTVLEREPSVAYHASGRSAALFEENYGKASVVGLNKASRQYHETANGGVLTPRGLLMVGRADETTLFDMDVDTMDLTRITVAEAAQMIPILNSDIITHAAYDGAALDIDTDLLVQNFAREVRGNGGLIVTNAAVSGINRMTDGWQVTADRVYDARQIVNAAGAWVDAVAVMAGINPLGFQPYRRSMGRIPAPGGQDVSGWPMVFGAGETWYAKPDAGALIVSPAEEDPATPHDAWADDMVLAEGLDRYAQYVTEPVTRLLMSWAGLRTFAPDRSLVLGPSAQDKTFIWCAGQGGYGFATAPAASQLLADIVGGQPSELSADLIASLNPARFS